MSENYRSSLYSIFIFVLAFSIINYYIKVAKEDKRIRLERQKVIQMKNPQSEESETRRNALKIIEMSCRPEDPFIHRFKPLEQCYRHQNLQ